MTAVLEARGLSVRRGRSEVLDRVSLAASAGRVTALIGPNGAGKSTLLAALSGDLAPAEGEARLHGRPLSAWTAAEMAQVRAVLPQQTRSAFGFTGLEAVLLGRSPWWDLEGEAAALDAAEAAMRKVGVLHFAGRSIERLSGGERQRVHLARCLAQGLRPPALPRQGPFVYLLDEPLESLDLAHQHAILRILQDLAKEGQAVLVVLHDLSLAGLYADHLVLLDRGRVVADGTPRQVLTSGTIDRVYGIPVHILEHPGSGRPLVVAR